MWAALLRMTGRSVGDMELAIWITSGATTLTAVGVLYQMWSNAARRVVPGYQTLRASYRSEENNHWVRGRLSDGELVAGKVVGLTRVTCRIAHPTVSTKEYLITAFVDWETLIRSSGEFPDWEPCG